jgi:hypothetical protein
MVVHGNYGPDARRTEALARAAKMMKLFNKNCFKDIMSAADKANANEGDFTTACATVVPKLEPEEIKWLWNYLKHVPDLWQGVPDAANAGW